MTNEGPNTRPTPWALPALLLMGAVLFFANTWGYDLWPSDEPRFGQVAREMVQSGDYLAPRVNGEPYKEKPPLLFWAISAASIPFGDVTEFSARAPSGIAGLAMVLFTYLLALRLYGRRVAWWSGVLLMTMNLFWWEARTVRTDMLLAACMTGALIAFWRWHEERSTRWLLALYGAIALGLYAKGPPALVFPLLFAVVFYWKRGEERRGLHLVLGTAAAVALVLAWFIPARMALPPAAVESPGAGVASEAFRQIIGRFLLGVSKAQPPWYYVFNLPVNLLPWALFLPWVLPWVWKRRGEDDRMRLLLAWTVPALIFFSISIGKRAVYLLPLFPALAILMSRSILELMDSDRATWRRRTGYVWVGFLMALGAIPFALLVAGRSELWSNSLGVFGVCVLALSLHALYQVCATDSRRLHVVITGHFAALAVLGAVLICPVVDVHKGASDICRPLRELTEAGEQYRLYSVGFSREEYIFYTKHFHKPMLTDLLPVELSREISLAEMAKKQRALRKAVKKAVEDVPVASLTDATDAEREALAKAVHDAAQEAKAGPELARAFEDALKNCVRKYSMEFNAPGPGFMFVQEEDWKWLIPLFPDLGKCSVIRRQSVGSRNVLLLANIDGAALVEIVSPAEAAAMTKVSAVPTGLVSCPGP